MDFSNCVAALRQAGVDVAVVTTSLRRAQLDPDPDGGQEWRLRRKGAFGATISHFREPFALASRRLRLGTALRQEVRSWSADVVMAGSILTLPLARDIARLSGARLAVRAHNVESTYYEALASSGGSPVRRLYLARERRLMARAEKRLYAEMTSQEPVFAITEPDRLALQTLAPHVPMSTVQPFSSPRVKGVSRLPERSAALMFGNLFTPNNADAALALADVWQGVRDRVPRAVLVLAGRDPSPALVEALESRTGVQVVANPVDVPQLYADCTVTVNYVTGGSGASLKVVDALANGRAVVANSLGGRGYEGLSPLALRIHATDEELVDDLAVLLTEHDVAQRALEAACEERVSSLAPSVAASRLLRALEEVTA